jgi:threonylcarbamoyladenosine tRNA methylthiotransferase MtaB
VRQIDREGIVPRLRIGSVEPNEVSDEFLQLMAASTSICPHLHLPLQSGSDSVLGRMGRLYTSAAFRYLVGRISSAMPDAFIGVDVIAGFPGETEAEFDETVRLIEGLPLSDLHVFPFSSRPGTRAASMPGHIPDRLVTERASILRKIAGIKQGLFLDRFIGSRQKVLTQQYDRKTGLCRGLSRNYQKVAFPGDADFVNCEIDVTVLHSDGISSTGESVLPTADRA